MKRILKITAFVVFGVPLAIIGFAMLVAGPPVKQDEAASGAAGASESALKTAADDAQVVCADGQGVVTGNELQATVDELNLRNGPGTEHARVVNDKLSDTLGRTAYVRLGPGSSAEELCRLEDWSKVRITGPGFAYEGWAANRYLEPVERTAGGARVYPEGAFYWTDNTRPYKDLIVETVNRIARENDRCAEAMPGGVSQSTTRGTADNPVFFVTCDDPDGRAFNVWFSLSEMRSGASQAAAPHIDQGRALALCREAARGRATRPGSVSFSLFGTGIHETPNGRTQMFARFSARNAFDAEADFRIRCLLDANGLIEATVTQAP